MRKLYWDLNNKLDVRKAWGKKNLKVAETCFIKKEGRKKKKSHYHQCFPTYQEEKKTFLKKLERKKEKKRGSDARRVKLAFYILTIQLIKHHRVSGYLS